MVETRGKWNSCGNIVFKIISQGRHNIISNNNNNISDAIITSKNLCSKYIYYGVTQQLIGTVNFENGAMGLLVLQLSHVWGYVCTR